jgi:hypothetical protein
MRYQNGSGSTEPDPLLLLWPSCQVAIQLRCYLS